MRARRTLVSCVLASLFVMACGPYVAFPGGKVRIRKICDDDVCSVPGSPAIRANPDSAPLYAEQVTSWVGHLYDAAHQDLPVACDKFTPSDLSATPLRVTKGTRTLDSSQQAEFDAKVKASLSRSVAAAAAAAVATTTAAPGSESVSGTSRTASAEGALKAALKTDITVGQSFTIEVHALRPDRVAALKAECASPFPLIRSAAIAHVSADVSETWKQVLEARIVAAVAAGQIDAELGASFKREIEEEIKRTVESVGFVIAFGLYE